MPCTRKYHVHRRKSRPSFQFLDLPPDLQFHVLSYLNLQTLKSAVTCSSHISALYTKYPNTFLQTATRYQGQQIQNLMLTTLSIARSIASVEMYLRPDPENLEKYFVDHLDADIPAEILRINESPLQVLDMVYALDWEVRSLVYDYAHETFGWACRFDNPGAVVPPLVLSATERHRITRAFWRLKLYGVLFYNYADRFGLDLSKTYSIFVDRLCAFEIDEMVTVYQFMVRNRHYFISSFPHDNCPFTGMMPYRNRDPFECPDCQGRHRFNSSRNQAFWHIMEDKYLGDRIMGADPAVCRGTPIKLWHDAEESNEPNAGYEESPSFAFHPGFGNLVSPRRAEYFSFRNRGICFWDKDRLEGWDFWDRTQPCAYCNGPCDV